jgi:sec-independent protein translocase protein TatB
MFGLNWPELLIISVVALIVIGPEDLPQMFRQLGRFTGKLRQMSREFSRAMEQAAKDTGVSDVARDLKAATSAKSLGLDAVTEAANKFEKWDPLKNAAKPTISPARPLTPPPMPATPMPAAPVASSLTSVAARDAAKADAPAEKGAEDLSEDDLEALEGLEDLADLEALDGASPAAANTHGPNTQALYDKAALRAKVLAEQTEKLKAIEAGTYVEPAPQDTAVPGLTQELDAKATKPGPKAAASDPATAAPKPKRTRAKAPAPVDGAEKSAERSAAKAGAKPLAKAAASKPKKPRKTAGEETA